MRLQKFMLLGSVAFLLAGCESDSGDKVEVEDQVVTEDKVLKAFCVVKPKSGSNVVGAVSFTEVDGGVRIVADVGGLSPGKHGFHVHEHGDCSAEDGASAGGHFNPTNMPHGGPDDEQRHVGDLGNLEVNNYGFAHYDRVDSLIKLDGEHSIIGKSIVIHEGEDDLTSQPTGNSGKRIGCGAIHAALQ